MARAVSFGQDGSASVEGVRERYDSELANDLGNLLSRTTAMVARYRDGAVAKVEPDAPVDFDSLRKDVIARIDVFDVTGALDQIWDGVRRLNQYVTTEAPWQLAKDEANAERLDRVLYTLVDGLTSVAVLLHAFLPETAPRILAALRQGDSASLDRVRNGGADAADGIEAAEPLFPRIELPSAAA
jgi:methionyl-tRNA synthetase